ncbi:MAG: TspO/MBR family protein [Beijerinckiaceae bacterium]
MAVVPVVAASALGQIATMPNLTPWFASLVKPSFNPPNWVFGPVWTVLYVMMAYSFYRVLRAPESDARRTAITIFLIQLAFNAAWSWGFFGFQSPLSGLLIIVPLLALILLTIREFARVDGVASLLLAPYATWVSFATALNASIWWLNR